QEREADVVAEQIHPAGDARERPAAVLGVARLDDVAFPGKVDLPRLFVAVRRRLDHGQLVRSRVRRRRSDDWSGRGSRIRLRFGRHATGDQSERDPAASERTQRPERGRNPFHRFSWKFEKGPGAMNSLACGTRWAATVGAATVGAAGEFGINWIPGSPG